MTARGAASRMVIKSPVRLLRAVAACAERDGRFEDALQAHGAILEEDPSDGDALYGRARVHGWSDKWGVETTVARGGHCFSSGPSGHSKAVLEGRLPLWYLCISNVWIHTVSKGGVSVWSSTASSLQFNARLRSSSPRPTLRVMMGGRRRGTSPSRRRTHRSTHLPISSSGSTPP